MSKSLDSHFVIPDKVLDQHVIVLGKTRAGKSSTMRLIVERMLDEQKPVCVIDPKGDWWGLKSSDTGKRAGYPVVIFGGSHADVPLNPRAGAQIAELVGTGNRPCIIDLGGWMVGERTRFFIDFASNLFRTMRGRRWLVIDEVHNFCPQGKVLDPDAGKMLHWANRLASEGLGKGLGIIAASQRPQKVHKDFITSCETLIAKRVIHPLDRNAMKEWIDGCGDPAKGAEVLSSLAGLDRKEGWVWSPEIGFGPTKVTFPMFKTFDSFNERGNQEPGELTGWAQVDLDEVKSKLAEFVEQAKENDPKELKAELAKARKDLAAVIEVAHRHGWNGTDNSKILHVFIDNALSDKPAGNPVPALKDGELERIEAVALKLDQTIKGLVDQAEAAAGKAAVSLDSAVSPLVKILGELRPEPKRYDRAPVTRRPTPTAEVFARANAKAAELGGVRLGKCERAILAVLSQYPDGCNAGKLTLLAGYRWSGSFSNSLGALRSAGLIEGSNGETMSITTAGMALGPYPTLPSGRDFVDYWLTNPHFGKCEREILEALVAHPKGLTAEQLLQATGYQWSGSFSNSLGSLRTAGVIVGKNKETLKASQELLDANQ